MPASLLIAPVGSSRIVSGSNSATVAGGPSPGRTPRTMPSSTPTTHIPKLVPASATSKPGSSPLSVSTAALLKQNARWQRYAESQRKQRIEAQSTDYSEPDCKALRFAEQHGDDEPRHQGERDDEPDDI